MISFTVLALFGLAEFFSIKFGADYLKIIPGVLLLYFLPGRNLNSILFCRRQKYPWFFRIPLDILSSIAVFAFFYTFLKSRIELGATPLVIFVLGSNIVIGMLAIFLSFEKITTKPTSQDKIILAFTAIPLLLFALRVIINPYIFDMDSLRYFDSFNKMLKTGKETGVLYSGREAFSFFMIASHYIAGFGYTMFFKFFTPLIFYFTSAIIFSFFSLKKKIPFLGYLAYLVILASPVVIIMNGEVRPETFSIALTIPALALMYLAVRDKDLLFAFLSLSYAVTSMRFHESGAALILAAISALAATAYLNRKQISEFIKNNYLWLIAITISYALLIKTYSSVILHFVSKGATSWTLLSIWKGLSKIKWTWWFLSNATTTNEAQIGWPGLSGIYYYFFDGITVFALIVFLLIILIKIKKKFKIDVNYLALMPIVILFIIHFGYAEILPRLGTVLLFNRSWPHIMLSSFVIAIILIRKISDTPVVRRQERIIGVFILFCALSGATGTIYVTTFMNSMVSPSEKTAIEELKKLPENSLIISTQRNHNLVKIYANLNFIMIQREKYDRGDFAKIVLGQIDYLATKKTEQILKPITIRKIGEKYIEYQKTRSSLNAQSEEVLDNQTKLEILKNFYPKQYADTISKIEQYKYPEETEIYFFYSFAKLNGILGTRKWWRENSDEQNYKFFKNYSGELVTRDKNFILIKIK